MRGVSWLFSLAVQRRPQGGGYSRNAEQPHISLGRLDYGHAFIRRCPNCRIGWAEKQDALCSCRGGEVRNSAVVPQEECVFEQTGEARKSEMFRKSSRFPFPSQFQQPRAVFVCFTCNHENRAARGEKILTKFPPILDRPIFCLAATARMNGDNRLGGVAKKSSSEFTIFSGWIDRRRRIFQM